MRSGAAGKPVYAFATAYSDDGYQLAAHASEIWLDPMGGVLPMGPGGSRTYYKGLLDQLGIEAHIYRVGTYKSAVEPYMRADQSPDAKAAAQALYDVIWSEWRDDVAKARPKAQLDKMLSDPAGQVEAAKGNLAQLALSNGLVDKLGDKSGVRQICGQPRLGLTATNAPAISPQRGLKHCSPPISLRHAATRLVW
jgi:protease-4